MKKKIKQKIKSKKKEINSDKLRHYYYIVCIVILSFLSLALAFMILNHPMTRYGTTPEKLWKQSQEIQKNNSFRIDAIKTITYIRNNSEVDSYSDKIKFYKDGNQWRAELTTTLSDDVDTFVSVYDGEALHDYVNADSPVDGVYQTELSINHGMTLYEQSQKEGYKETLESIIKDFNYADKIINWYPQEKYKSPYAKTEKEHPVITGRKEINHYPCINIKFSNLREACINEDYGIAIYWKLIADESKYPGSPNKESILEFKVNNIKNTEKDKIYTDRSLFHLPDIKPVHVYGEY